MTWNGVCCHEEWVTFSGCVRVCVRVHKTLWSLVRKELKGKGRKREREIERGKCKSVYFFAVRVCMRVCLPSTFWFALEGSASGCAMRRGRPATSQLEWRSRRDIDSLCRDGSFFSGENSATRNENGYDGNPWEIILREDKRTSPCHCDMAGSICHCHPNLVLIMGGSIAICIPGHSHQVDQHISR